ncbi:hypothetical protein Taro_044866, partial [Colocasia esculenta]|nr:hypothetical protein [Colocasia esculenta]
RRLRLAAELSAFCGFLSLLGWGGILRFSFRHLLSNKQRAGRGKRAHRDRPAYLGRMDYGELWAIFGPGVAGAVFGVGWWLWVDAVVCSAVKIAFLHYLPGIFASLAALMFNCVKKDDIDYSPYEEGEWRSSALSPLFYQFKDLDFSRLVVHAVAPHNEGVVHAAQDLDLVADLPPHSILMIPIDDLKCIAMASELVADHPDGAAAPNVVDALEIRESGHWGREGQGDDKGGVSLRQRQGEVTRWRGRRAVDGAGPCCRLVARPRRCGGGPIILYRPWSMDWGAGKAAWVGGRGLFVRWKDNHWRRTRAVDFGVVWVESAFQTQLDEKQQAGIAVGMKIHRSRMLVWGLGVEDREG